MAIEACLTSCCTQLKAFASQAQRQFLLHCTLPLQSWASWLQLRDPEPLCVAMVTPHDLLLGRVMMLEAVQFRLNVLIELVPLSQTCASASRDARGQCPRPCSLQVHDSLIDMWLHLTMMTGDDVTFDNLGSGLLQATFPNHVWLQVGGTATEEQYSVMFLGYVRLGCQANGCKRKSKLLGEVSEPCRFPAKAIKPMFRIGDHYPGNSDAEHERAQVCFHCLHALCVGGREMAKQMKQMKTLLSF